MSSVVHWCVFLETQNPWRFRIFDSPATSSMVYRCWCTVLDCQISIDVFIPATALQHPQGFTDADVRFWTVKYLLMFLFPWLSCNIRSGLKLLMYNFGYINIYDVFIPMTALPTCSVIHWRIVLDTTVLSNLQFLMYSVGHAKTMMFSFPWLPCQHPQ